MNRRIAGKRYDGIDRARELLKLSEKRKLTAEEIEELKTSHTGYGGLSWVDFSQYFTPNTVTSFIVDLLEPKDGDSCLEFSCGSGSFINALYRNNPNIKITGMEISYELAEIASLCYPQAKIIKGDALDQMDKFEGSMDFVVGNPPFGIPIKRSGFEIAKKTSEQYFLEMAVRCLKEGGTLALILPDGLLSNSNCKKIREWLFDKCYYLGTISLPTETFYFAGATVKTSVVLAKKKYVGHEVEDYLILMAICKHIGWDKRGKSTGICDLNAIKEEYLKMKKKQAPLFMPCRKAASF